MNTQQEILSSLQNHAGELASLARQIWEKPETASPPTR